MDAIAVVLVGIGAYLMYAAYKGELDPFSTAKASVTKAGGSGS